MRAQKIDREGAAVQRKQKQERSKPGRPTETNRPTRKIYLTLDDATIEKARATGGDNVSAGVREAVRRVKVKK